MSIATVRASACPRLALLLSLVLLQLGRSSQKRRRPSSGSSVISTQPIKEGVMKRRRFLVASVGTLVLGGLLLVSGGPGVTPAWAQNPTPQQQQLRQIWTSSIRSWRPLRRPVREEKREERRVTKIIRRCHGIRLCRRRSGSSFWRPLTATRCWIKKPGWSGRSPRSRPRYPRQTPAWPAPIKPSEAEKVGACLPFQSWPVWWIPLSPLRARLFRRVIRFWLSSRPTIGQRRRMRTILTLMWGVGFGNGAALGRQ